MTYNRIGLEGAWIAILHVVLDVLYPTAQRTQSDPAQNHRQQSQASEEEPVKAFLATAPCLARMVCTGCACDALFVDIYVRSSGLGDGYASLRGRGSAPRWNGAQFALASRMRIAAPAGGNLRIRASPDLSAHIGQGLVASGAAWHASRLGVVIFTLVQHLVLGNELIAGRRAPRTLLCAHIVHGVTTSPLAF